MPKVPAAAIDLVEVTWNLASFGLHQILNLSVGIYAQYTPKNYLVPSLLISCVLRQVFSRQNFQDELAMNDQTVTSVEQFVRFFYILGSNCASSSALIDKSNRMSGLANGNQIFGIGMRKWYHSWFARLLKV